MVKKSNWVLQWLNSFIFVLGYGALDKGHTYADELLTWKICFDHVNFALHAFFVRKNGLFDTILWSALCATALYVSPVIGRIWSKVIEKLVI